MKLKALAAAAVIAASSSAALGARAADQIPYPNAGTPNPIVYTFTATTTGDIVAYFAGSTASYDNQLGMLDNGVLTSAGYGLDNHSSSIGQAFNLGFVTAGDTLTFVLDNLTLGMQAYSNPAMNLAYDSPGDTLGHNHVYSTAYTATDPVFGATPAGTFVGFEDLPFPGSDFNYNDETFVITDVSTATAVPEPVTWAMMILGLGMVGLGIRANVVATRRLAELQPEA